MPQKPWEWHLLPIFSGGSSFILLLYWIDDVSDYAGFWPFNCDKIIPCQEFEGQTCGCSDADGTNVKAIVYFLGASSKMASEKLNFKSCDDLQDNGMIYDGDFKLDNGESGKTYCKSAWNR